MTVVVILQVIDSIKDLCKARFIVKEQNTRADFIEDLLNQTQQTKTKKSLDMLEDNWKRF